MDSLNMTGNQKPHAVCIPYPAQGHVNPMLKLAKLLHHKGFHITFVNTEFNHKRLLNSRGPDSLNGLSDFKFETIPDGLPPPTDSNATQDIPSLCDSTSKTCLTPFRNLLSKLNSSSSSSSSSSASPPITCIVSDGCMSFTLEAAQELGIPEVLFWTTSACGFMGYLHYKELIQRGLTPLKEEIDLNNGYLENQIDWIPGMKDIRFKDLPSFIRTTDTNDVMVNFLNREAQRTCKASGIITNTFESFESEVLNAMKSVLLPPIFSIGPLQLLINNQIPKQDPTESLGSNLWKEETECLQWLGSKKPNSVVYVNFGSITVMTSNQLIEFAWGLANSEKTFLWIIRPDLVKGQSETSHSFNEFITVTKERSFMANWCPQEKVLKHSSIGGFLTHSGWNSTMDTICAGVPVICWPFFAEQQTNCRYSCRDWGIGMEIDSDVKRDEVEILVRELMDGEKGMQLKKRAMEWRKEAEEAAGKGGSSYVNFEKLVNDVLMVKMEG